ncbi:toxin [Pontibacillus sp. HMF3514]|uniref:anthrax toxin lethal factor-related metalloendopeptidase n=1 Tax=Pontibacillus sp. HMF3514 TaxID=2692425 RepID=UPI00132048B6|nr:toxin [Pontibacillus sp. HMF3514]QHE52457.1 toxin [Pontibacillus sp. HMF3514]
MLRFFVTVFIITLCMIVPSIEITKPFTGITLNKAISREKSSKLTSLQNEDILKSMIMVPPKVEDKQSMEDMLTTIDGIDRPLLQFLQAKGVMIRLFKGNLTDEPLLFPLKWQNPRGWEQDVTWSEVPGSGGGWLISAKIGSSSPGNGHSSLNLELHEIGHTVYNHLSNSQKEQFKEAWQEEVKTMFPNREYFSSYISEYFSESFAFYYYNATTSKHLKWKAPLTFKFMEVFKKKNAGF